MFICIISSSSSNIIIVIIITVAGVDRELLAGCLERRPKKTYALAMY